LTELVGPARALEWMLTGRRITRDEAVRQAIALPAATSARAEATAWAHRHLRAGDGSVAAILRCVDASLGHGVNGLDVEFDEVLRLFASDYAQDRIAEFTARRR